MKLADIDNPLRLDTAAETLERDGHTDLAAQYHAQAETAREQRQAVARIGERAHRFHNIAQRQSGSAAVDDFDFGLNLADWLVEHGWTPPAPLAVQDQGLGDILANVGSAAQ